MKQHFPAKTHAPRRETFQEVLSRRIARRSFLQGALAAVPLLLVGTSMLIRNRAEAASDGLAFQPILLDDQDRVARPRRISIRSLDSLGRSVASRGPFLRCSRADRRQTDNAVRNKLRLYRLLSPPPIPLPQPEPRTSCRQSRVHNS